MAYNNGLVLLTEELVVRSDDDGASFIEQMRGLQIVNGGQTTATIFFTKRDSSNQIDLSQVRVPAKIIVTGENNNLEAQEEFVGKVARFANTQNPIKESDFWLIPHFIVTLKRFLNQFFVRIPSGAGFMKGRMEVITRIC